MQGMGGRRENSASLWDKYHWPLLEAGFQKKCVLGLIQSIKALTLKPSPGESGGRFHCCGHCDIIYVLKSAKVFTSVLHIFQFQIYPFICVYFSKIMFLLMPLLLLNATTKQDWVDTPAFSCMVWYRNSWLNFSLLLFNEWEPSILLQFFFVAIAVVTLILFFLVKCTFNCFNKWALNIYSEC